MSFDANSAALVIGTPMRNYQKMSAKVRFVLDKPQKTFHLVVKKNQHQMELDGRAEAGEAELKLATTLAGLESAMAAGRYDLSSRKTLSLKLSLNDKTVQVGGSLEGLKISIKATDYRKIQLNGDVQLTAQTSTLPLDVGNGRKAFPSHRIAHWPQIGRPDQHALHRIGNDGHERPSLARPMFLASQYDLGQSLQFGRLVLTHNGFRYRNELVAKLILLGVQFPIDGLCNMTSSLIYDLTSSEKSLIVTLDNAVQH